MEISTALPAVFSNSMCVLPPSFASNSKIVPLCIPQGPLFESSLTLFIKMLSIFLVWSTQWFGVKEYLFGKNVKASDQL